MTRVTRGADTETDFLPALHQSLVALDFLFPPHGRVPVFGPRPVVWSHPVWVPQPIFHRVDYFFSGLSRYITA
jgi:hypothetical protein